MLFLFDEAVSLPHPETSNANVSIPIPNFFIFLSPLFSVMPQYDFHLFVDNF